MFPTWEQGAGSGAMESTYMVKQERAARTRSALIAAAAEVFSREGYCNASLVAISGQAGVTNGALHFHFPTKSALAAAVTTAAARRFEGVVAQGERRMGQGGALQLLIDTSHVLVCRLREDTVLRAGFDLGGDPGSPQGLDEVSGLWQRWVESTLERADTAGELLDGVSAEHVAIAVVAGTVGFQVLAKRDPRWASHRVLTRFWCLLLPRVSAVPAELRGGGSG